MTSKSDRNFPFCVELGGPICSLRTQEAETEIPRASRPSQNSQKGHVWSRDGGRETELKSLDKRNIPVASLPPLFSSLCQWKRDKQRESKFL